MNDQSLIDYLEGNLNVSKLVHMLRRLRGKSHLTPTEGFFNERKKIEVTVKHLIRICDDFLSGDLDPMSMETLAFLMMGTDALDWDSDSPAGSLIAETLDDWASPELAYPLTYINILTIRDGLILGVCLGKEVSQAAGA